MFTGIIEEIGTIESITEGNGNLYLNIYSSLAPQIAIDDSIAHNGICLTVTQIVGNVHTVCAIAETREKTCINHWRQGDKINLERAMVLGSRLDGHIVQGHVDATAQCLSVVEQNGSWYYTFSIPKNFEALLIEKGSICINGTSLTCFDITKDTFAVAIIPYTYEHTMFPQIKQGTLVNLEFDIIGKYLQRQLAVLKQ